MVNFASNERYGGEGLRERLMEQGLKLPLSHPRPQVRLSFPPPPSLWRTIKKIQDSRVFFTDGKQDFIYEGNIASQS